MPIEIIQPSSVVEVIQPQRDRVRILGCFDPNYGSFYDTTTQLFNDDGLPEPIRVNTTVFRKHMEIVEDSRIKVDFSGKYDIQFSAQFEKLSGGTHVAELWIAKNGTALPYTNTQLTLSGGSGSKSVAAWNWFVEAEANDYFEIYWWADAINTIRIYANEPNTRPGIPSIIVTVSQVG
jgi:hypothetical protein